jgi:hypothetical protein
MGRGGLDQPGRRRLFEAKPSGADDPDNGEDPLLVGEVPPEDAPADTQASFDGASPPLSQPIFSHKPSKVSQQLR